jgi:hypothetical protein
MPESFPAKSRNMSDQRAAETNSGAAFKYGSNGAKTGRPRTCQAASGDCEVSRKAQRTPSTELDIAAQQSKYHASSDNGANHGKSHVSNGCRHPNHPSLENIEGIC